MDVPNHHRLDDFLAGVDREAVILEVVREHGGDADALRRRLDTYLNECHVGLDLLLGHLAERPRLLEVGAGIGALSAFLSLEGFDVTALEPAGQGFQVVDAFRTALERQWPGLDRPFLAVGVEHIPDGLEPFAVVYSVHVLEHVPDVETAIRAIHRQLVNGGVSVHVCPNYSFPFDPHFGVPLLPVRPKWTERILSRDIVASELWQSLNFVTARRVTKIADRLGLEIDYRPGVMGEMVDRLDADPVFRQRHRRIVRLSELLFGRLRLRRVLDRWPAHYASPMVFQLRRR
jgi:2-polyprenyl-3-methyl-5-hydroxy-6-metoxy-1,4-benzoquinol methylase